MGRLPTLADSAITRLIAFDPRSATSTFKIALTDLGQAVFFPALVAGLGEIAPGCSLDVVDLNTQTVAADLVSGAVDLAVSSTELPGALSSTVMRWDTYCCVSRAGRFSGACPSLEEITALPRVVVRGSTGHTLIQQLLPAPPAGSVHLSGFAAIPGIVSATDLVAFVPEAITSEWVSRWNFEVRPLPRDVYSASVRAHAALDITSAATAWFVEWAVATMTAV
ncbi:hypothetical protein JT358_10405 [Micrococcales bacterium 31B]|nr:hypothetical protein [Micrococcales bacterium 31B]